MAVIEVRDLTRRYGQGETAVQALAGVTLSIGGGELVSVVGRSGSGKTTLLHAAGLLLRPTSGDVLVDGVATAGLTDGQRASLRGRRIGFVLREGNLLPTLSVLENVLLPLRYARPGRGARERARDLLDLVGLGDRLDRRPGELAPGLAQRAALARALVREPAVVLADEPTGEVDEQTSDGLIALVREINRISGVAFLVATHDVEVGSCMDRMIRIGDGRVISDARRR